MPATQGMLTAGSGGYDFFKLLVGRSWNGWLQRHIPLVSAIVLVFVVINIEVC